MLYDVGERRTNPGAVGPRASNTERARQDPPAPVGAVWLACDECMNRGRARAFRLSYMYGAPPIERVLCLLLRAGRLDAPAFAPLTTAGSASPPAWTPPRSFFQPGAARPLMYHFGRNSAETPAAKNFGVARSAMR